jgi:membrane protein implicated in regulation of membrane protease activity
MSSLGYVLVYAGLGVFAAGTIKHGMRITLADPVADALMAAGYALVGGPFLIMSAAFVVMTVIMTWLWWKRRKRRGRLAAVGAKSKARIAAMAARMRERPARPVLRPVPQGGAR